MTLVYSACLTGKFSCMEHKQLFRLTFLRVHIILVAAEMPATAIGNYCLICEYFDTCFSPRKVGMQWGTDIAQEISNLMRSA